MGASEADEAQRMLAEVNRLRTQAGAKAHAGAWLPAALVAALLLGSIFLYRYPFPLDGPYELFVERPLWAGLPDYQRDPALSYAYWFIGVPLLFAGSALWYRWRARRYGMAVNWWVFAGTGMAALLGLAVLAAVPASSSPAEVFSGSGGAGAPILSGSGLLTPLLVVAASVIALGFVERSRGMIGIGLWVALITVWQCVYGQFLGEIPGWFAYVLGGFEEPVPTGGQITLFGLDRPGPTLILMAAPLIAFAVVRAVRAVRVGE